MSWLVGRTTQSYWQNTKLHKITTTHLERHEPEAVREQGRVPKRPLVRPLAGAVVVGDADLRDGGDLEGLLVLLICGILLICGML